MGLTINNNPTVQVAKENEKPITKKEDKTEQKAVTLTKDQIKMENVNRGFNAGFAGAAFGIPCGLLLTKGKEFGFLAGAGTGLLAGVVSSQTTHSWWKGALVGGAVGAASGAIIGVVSGKGAGTGAIVGAAAGITGGSGGALSPTKLIEL